VAALENAKHEKFAQGIAQGLSQRKAYREAFPNSQKWKDETVDSKACNLAKEDKVSARLQELREESSSKAVKSTQSRKEWLSSIIDDMAEDMNTRLKACDMLNKMDGEYTNKVEARVTYEDSLKRVVDEDEY
jgi:CRISPR/Cas system-associated endonuclease Cas1